MNGDTASVNHDCGKLTYEYLHIFQKEGLWHMEIDSQSEVVIYYCPFCGIRLN